MTVTEPAYLTEGYDDTKDVIISDYDDGTCGLVLIGVDTNLVPEIVEIFMRNRLNARRQVGRA